MSDLHNAAQMALKILADLETTDEAVNASEIELRAALAAKPEPVIPQPAVLRIAARMGLGALVNQRSETFYKDSRGDASGKAIDALREALGGRPDPAYDAARAQRAVPAVPDAEAWLRRRYGAYRGHPAWRELEEAFNAGALATSSAAPIKDQS